MIRVITKKYLPSFCKVKIKKISSPITKSSYLARYYENVNLFDWKTPLEKAFKNTKEKITEFTKYMKN